MNSLYSEEVIVLSFIVGHMLSTCCLWVESGCHTTGETTNFTGASTMSRICFACLSLPFSFKNNINQLDYLLSAVVALALHGYQMVMALSLLVMLMGTCMCMKKWVLN